MKSIQLLVILLLLVLSCDTKISQPAESGPYEIWKSKNIHDYIIEQKRVCYCPNSNNLVRISVRSDTISSVTSVSDGSIVTYPYYFTIDSLFGIIKSNDYDSIVVRYNEEYGYPEYIDVDPQQHPVDGGFLYETKLKEFYTTSETNRAETRFSASEFRGNVFFFLDTLYRNHYNLNFYKSKTNDPTYKVLPYVDTLEIYIKIDIYQAHHIQDSFVQARISDDEMYYFSKLIPEKHYVLFPDQGYIRFDTTINNYDLVGIYMRAGNGMLKKGIRGDTLTVWTLKPRTPIINASDDPERFYLMWRNVYHLDTNMLSNLRLSIVRVKEGENSTLYTIGKYGEKRLISAMLGLTDDDGKTLIDCDHIYDRRNEFIIVPPYDTCPTCNEPFNNPALGADYRDSVIYRFSHESYQWREYRPNHSFILSGNTKVTL